MTADIVVIGSINADLTVRTTRHPSPGETLLGSGGQISPGGKGANQATAAALLGGTVAMLGAVGDDPAADSALRGLRTSGVDISGVATVPGPTGLAIITVAEDGENTIVVVPGANASVDAEALSAHQELIASAQVVVAQGEIPREGTEQAARWCQGRLILNPAPVGALAPEVLHAADPLIVNEHEASLILTMLTEGQSRAEDPPPDIMKDPSDLARALLAAGPRSVVLTLGAHGAVVATPGTGSKQLSEVTTVPAHQVHTVDTTGAGDAYVGAIAVRLSEGADLVQAAHFATMVSAHVVQYEGAQDSYPRRIQVRS